MAQYRRLHPWFARGRFIGIDELTHLHVLGDKSGGILVAFNLENKVIDRGAFIDPKDLRMNSAQQPVTGARIATDGDRLWIDFSMAPLSPKVIELGLGKAATEPTQP